MAEIGTVYVKVVPVIDTEALRAVLDLIDAHQAAVHGEDI